MQKPETFQLIEHLHYPLSAQHQRKWRWPVGTPLCRPLGSGLCEIRTDLPTERTARVLLCV